jgi:hypothetical protein
MDSTDQQAPASVPAAGSGPEPAGCKPDDNGALGQAAINTFFKSALDRGKQAERVSVLPISIEPCPPNGPSRGGERIAQNIERGNEIQTAAIPGSCRGHCRK